MFKIVRDELGNIYKWVVLNLDGNLNNISYYPNSLTLGIFIDNIIIAGVIYHMDTEKGICYITFYADNPKWCNKENLSKILMLPFEEFKEFDCKIVKCLTSSRNKRVNKLLWGLKLRHEGHLRFGRHDGTDENVFSITEKELKNKRWFKI